MLWTLNFIIIFGVDKTVDNSTEIVQFEMVFPFWEDLKSMVTFILCLPIGGHLNAEQAESLG